MKIKPRNHRIILGLIILTQTAALVGSPSGYVIGWGQNGGGQATGISSYASSTRRPATAQDLLATNAVTIGNKPLTDIVAVAASDGFSLALRQNGTIVGWGANLKKQVSVGEASLFTTSSGEPPATMSAFFTGSNTVLVSSILTNIVAVASGGPFSMALRRSGDVLFLGKATLPDVPTNVVSIAACDFTALTLMSDGTVDYLKAESEEFLVGRMALVEGLSNIIAIAAGGGENMIRNVALRKDGTVTNWGTETRFRDSTQPSTLDNVIAIAAGLNHTLALRHDGTVIGWGFNESGQATGVPTKENPYVTSGPVILNGKILTGVTAVSANYEYSLALKNDGTVVGWGEKCPQIPEGLKGVVAISAGLGYCLAITTNKDVAKRFSPSK